MTQVSSSLPLPNAYITHQQHLALLLAMKPAATLLSLGLVGLVGLVLGDAPIITPNSIDAAVVADQYIVVYKDDISLRGRKRHEIEIDSRARGASKGGIEQTFDLPGFSGYSVEIAPDGLARIAKDNMVCSEYSPLTDATCQRAPPSN